ncbi:MAG: double-strand break repair helicase AddA [Alphaproteobacteria bacterium]|nr:double-strand break repair helicase AddA [Alphaproteobacteria bacterium]
MAQDLLQDGAWRRDPPEAILPTVEQYRAADPGRSVWVGASAGTGKTQVLTNRVLALLLTGVKPERLLCITFTNAAAAEMRNRITRKLAEWATASDPWLSHALEALTGGTPDREKMARARRLFAQVLDTPAGLKIQTIHGFCQAILRRFPVEAGLPPQFEIMDERTAAERLDRARDAVLARIAEGDATVLGAVETIIQTTEETGFADILAQIIRERARLTDALKRHGGLDGVMSAVAGHLGIAPDFTVADALADAVAEANRYESKLVPLLPELMGGKKTDVTTAEALRRYFEGGAEDRSRRYPALAKALLTKDGAPRKNPVTKDFAHLKPLIEEFQDRCVAMKARMDKAAILAATRALTTLGTEVLARYGEEKARHAALDYDDLILTVRDLLARDGFASWVMYKLDRGIDHVLVDEAQDTNPEQWEIIRALTAEFFAGEGAEAVAPDQSPEIPPLDRTLFVVGDVKQSIYSFQRADPTWFTRMRAHFAERIRDAGMVFDTVDLDLSFRSTAAVLGLVDRVFADPAAADGVVDGDVALHHVPHRQGEAGAVALYPLEAPGEVEQPDFWDPDSRAASGPSPRATVAEAIALRIDQWLRDATPLPSKGRPIRPGDILILVRRRTGFVDDLVRALKQRAVPVAGVDRMVLTEQIMVQDLTAVADFLLLPEDDLTLATVLKGPLFGYDDDDLFRLAHGRPRHRGLWDVLRDSGTPKDIDTVARLRDWLDATDYVGPYELFSRILKRDGGWERIYARFGEEAKDPIEEFLALTLDHEKSHPPGLQSFLHWFRKREGEIKRDLDEGSGDQVRIMTVHGAKGLEAPIVFLPDTAQTPQSRDRLFWIPDGTGALPLWSPRAAFDEDVVSALKQARQRSQMQEYRRLLYVALTRAADALHIAGWLTRKPAADTTWYEHTALGFTDAAPGEDGARILLAGTPSAPREVPAVPEKSPVDLPAFATRPAGPEPDPPAPLAPSRPSEEDPPVRSPLSGDSGDRFRRGKILHKLLEHLPTLPKPIRRERAAHFLASPVHDLSPETQAAYLDEVFTLLDDPDLDWLFDPATGQAEVSLSGLLDTRPAGPATVVTGQIDRLVIASDRIAVIDYKTNRPPPDRIEGAPRVYLRQLATYRALLKDIFPGRSIACALLWTDAPHLMWVPTEMMDAIMNPEQPEP